MTEHALDRIARLRRERDAVVLAHYYQPGEIQDLADFVGDSLELCRKAAATTAKVIVFCGVRFMAESAALFNPDKVVLLPDAHAGCPMADMITGDSLRAWKKEHPGRRVICYVNSTAEVKAECDICCTSSNAERVVRSVPDGVPILFAPDKHLGSWVAERTGRPMDLWPGYCPTHAKILPENIRGLKERHPGALAAVHPECPRETRDTADYVGSTAQIIRWCTESKASTFIVGTELGILHPLKKANPGKTFLPATDLALCPNMKKIDLDKVARALETLEPRVTVDPAIAKRALAPIERMLAL